MSRSQGDLHSSLDFSVYSEYFTVFKNGQVKPSRELGAVVSLSDLRFLFCMTGQRHPSGTGVLGPSGGARQVPSPSRGGQQALHREEGCQAPVSLCAPGREEGVLGTA